MLTKRASSKILLLFGKKAIGKKTLLFEVIKEIKYINT
jgi:hypothetical protein